MQIDREDFIKELDHEAMLREYVRKAINIVVERNKDRKRKAINERTQLRSIVKKLIQEVKVQNPEDAPHESTGINYLRSLLKKVLPIIEDDFKMLTTSKEQRLSYRAHIVSAVQDALAPPKVTDKAGELEEALFEQGDIGIAIQDTDGQPGFIDIEDEEPKSQEDTEKETFSLEGQDETGRDAAYDTFKRIESNFVTTWGKLYTDEDKELFYDFLITNLKMHFDRFENDLQQDVSEPTTPEYEEQLAAAGTEEMGAAGELGAPEEEPEL
jgi:hypothetical protein